jgi:DNA helicase HerA-like ATPase
MTHSLILGMTLSGKTTLAKKLCVEYRKAGIPVLILDPICDPNWQCDFITDDKDEFVRVYKQNTGCQCIIDEAGDAVGKYDEVMRQTATRGRHWGHKFTYITQRGSSLSMTVRDQCATLFLFRSGMNDAKLHAEEYGFEELKNANLLKPGEFYHVSKLGTCVKKRIF